MIEKKSGCSITTRLAAIPPVRLALIPESEASFPDHVPGSEAGVF